MNNSKDFDYIKNKTLTFLDIYISENAHLLQPYTEEIKKFYIANRTDRYKEIEETIQYELPNNISENEVISKVYAPLILLDFIVENENIQNQQELLEEIALEIPLIPVLISLSIFTLLVAKGHKLSSIITGLLSKIYSVAKSIDSTLKHHKYMKQFINSIPKECIKEFIKEYDLVKDVINQKDIEELITRKYFARVPIGKLFNYKELQHSKTIKCAIESLSSAAAIQLKTYLDCLTQTKSLDKLNHLINAPGDLLVLPDSPLINTLSKSSPEACKKFLEDYKDTVKLLDSVIEKIWHNDVATQNEFKEIVAKKVEKIITDFLKEYQKKNSSSSNNNKKEEKEKNLKRRSK
jgi:hypothetical protein